MEFFQLNCCIFYCCCYLVAGTVGSSHQGVLWKKAFLEISQISWESTSFEVSFNEVVGLIICGSPVGFTKSLRAPILKNLRIEIFQVLKY